MAELNKEKVLASQLLTVSEFKKYIGAGDSKNEAIAYHYGDRAGIADNLDFVRIGRDCFIVFNERAKSFRLYNHYKGRPQKDAERKASSVIAITA